ncbi:RNA polymerase sigma factor [Sphingomonas sp. PB4P5]|uniref:RNA polymerase sigma factor n=1 Tax=Parasphingomonas puruogangriensis TaxID=3096155 RepID=UPI002FC6AE4A
MSNSGLEAIFLANRDKLLRFIGGLGAGNDAEDVLHELWLRASSTDTGPIAAPLSYLYRAAHNLMLDRHRSVARARLRDRAWSEVNAGAGEVSEEPDAERLLIARQQARIAQAALTRVGERAALIFRRHRIDGVEQRAIAAELGISLSTVEADLRKTYAAMIALKQDFDEGLSAPTPSSKVGGYDAEADD